MGSMEPTEAKQIPLLTPSPRAAKPGAGLRVPRSVGAIVGALITTDIMVPCSAMARYNIRYLKCTLK